MEENLVGYVLDALEPDDRAAVEARLREHPEAQAQADAVRRAVAPLAADAEAPAPPPGLALSTLARIAEYRCRSIPAAPPPSPYQRGPGRRWFRRADVLAAAALLVLVGGIGVPSLIHQWRAYQRRACANNLRGLWEGLAQYSYNHDGTFPAVTADGPHSVAGIFVPMLRDAGVLSPEVSVGCPAQGRQAPPPQSVADLESLYNTRRDEFHRVARDLTGGYAYSLGYWDGEQLCGPRRDAGDAFPILADRAQAADHGNSLNHGGAGQNVLYTGGNVRWVTERTVGPGRDDIYINQRHQLLAGVNRTDAVLAPGDASPCRNGK